MEILLHTMQPREGHCWLVSSINLERILTILMLMDVDMKVCILLMENGVYSEMVK